MQGRSDTLDFYIGVSLERLHSLLKKQIVAGLCFDLRKEDGEVDITPIRQKAILITTLLIESANSALWSDI